jgi:hypothetical protein
MVNTAEESALIDSTFTCGATRPRLCRTFFAPLDAPVWTAFLGPKRQLLRLGRRPFLTGLGIWREPASQSRAAGSGSAKLAFDNAAGEIA